MNIKHLIMICIFFLALAFLASATETPSGIQYAENSDTSCDINGECSSTIYSYQKYYQDQGIWKQIDENFGTQNCEPGYQYCVDGNLYQFNIKNTFSDPLVTHGNTRLSFNVASFGNLPLTSATSFATVQNNIVTYPNVIPNVDIQYTYLPHKVKEELIVKDRRLFTAFTNDVPLEFTLNPQGGVITSLGNALKIGDLYITDLIAYDQKGETITIPFSLTGNTLRLNLPINWLKNETTQYPVIVDPTIQTNLSVAADTHITNAFTLSPPQYNRAPASFRLKVGYEFNDIDDRSTHRTGIDFNVSSVPDNASVLGLTLTMYASTKGSDINHNISVVHMDGNSFAYPDNSTSSPCKGNCHYFIDMGNGTRYTTTNYSLNDTFHYFNLINATTDFANALSTGMFSVGLFSIRDDYDQVDGPVMNPRLYKSSEAAQANDRPRLTINYSVLGANEVDGDAAITQGILNSLPSAVIHTEQQIYARNSVNMQQLGRFDRYAMYNNQRWAFNYVTSGESFTNMNNISTNFYVLELADLFASDITAQVSAFINATKS